MISKLLRTLGLKSSPLAMSFRPVVVSGPSGGGKSTILTRLFKEYPNVFAFSVSHTTRNPRPGETHGKDYYFVAKDVMQKSIDDGEFLEHATFGGNLYGTSMKAVKDIQATGKICILDIEIQGVRSVKKTDLNARYVFVKPPSMDELEKRLRLRATETEESLQKRLKQARIDMEAVSKETTLFDHVIINDDLEGAYREFFKIIENDVNKFQQSTKTD